MRRFALVLAPLAACSFATSLDGLRGDGGGGTDAAVEADAKTDGPPADAAVDAGPPRWVDVSVGAAHACAVASTGAVYCWGRNQSLEIAQPASVLFATTPVKVDGVTSAVKVSAGAHHTCVLLADASVVCWGDNGSGALGVPLAKVPGKTATPTPVEGIGAPAPSR